MNYVPRSSLFNSIEPSETRLVSLLLAARLATAGAGNRRALFARMDEILSGTAHGAIDNARQDAATLADGAAVRLARIRLRNWKSFERADIILPEGGPGKSMIVIGGANGFGKSSLLEAFAFAMFGRRALNDIGFLMNATGSRSGQRRTYKSMLERSLHRSDRSIADGMSSVALDFATDDGMIAIERKWYFDEQGSLVEDEEELLVRLGEDRHLLETPAGVSSREWYQEEIERRVMPAALAPFFVFDGEQVERWADRRLSEQVRLAVERMLGLHDLAGLAEDLKDYARDREKGATDEAFGSLGALQTDVDRREEELEAAKAQLATLEAKIATYRKERDAALARLATAGRGSHADQQALLESEHRLGQEIARLERELLGVLVEAGPLLLAGKELIGKVAGAIGRPEMVDGVAGLDRAEIALLWERFLAVEPPLKVSQTKALRSRFERALTPDGGLPPASDQHAHLDRNGRRAAAAMLGAAQDRDRSRLCTATDELMSARQRLTVIAEAARARALDALDREQAQADLAKAADLIEGGEGDRGALRSHVETLSVALSPLREDLARRRLLQRDIEPRLRSAAAARSLASLVDGYMTRVADAEHQRFAEAVTKSFRALAHKDQISRIDIKADGTITLFDAAGRDVTDYRLSAGESQLFAVALIAAVGELMGDRFPLIVDTPLGRLDTRHRDSVLAMLGRRTAQTILLTQPEEITARHLAMLQPVLAGSARLEHGIDDASGVGVSRIVENYEPAVLA